MKKITVYLLYSFLLLSLIGWTQSVFAQDAEPTDRPFPGAVTSPDAAPTDRPFPGAAATNTEAFNNEPTATVTDAETTPELLIADIQATADAAQAQIVQLETERDSLLTELEASQTDNGATTFALVIIVIGVLMALGVFFGLRRGGE